MILIKDMGYTFIGRPMFFDDEQRQREYLPPQEFEDMIKKNNEKAAKKGDGKDGPANM